MSGTISFQGSTTATGGSIPQVVSAANPLPVTISGGLAGLAVAGTLADGAAAGAQFPVTTGGVDSGTGLIHRFSVDATGALNVVLAGGGALNVQGTIANGAVGNPNPVVMGGRLGTTVNDAAVNGNGESLVSSFVANGAAGNPAPIVAAGRNQATGNINTEAVDAAGALLVRQATAANFLGTMTQGPGNTGTPWTVQGPVASAGAAGGNPVSIGGDFNSTPTAIATGQRGIAQLDASSNLRVKIALIQAAGADAVANNVGFASRDTTQLAILPLTGQMVSNGATWDRSTKPRTAFRVPSSAASNNAANIKATPGTVYSISANVTLAASTCYLKFFDTTGSPNPAALTPLYMFALNIVNGAVSLVLPTNGLYFPTGIGMAIVANPADLDNTAIAAGQVTALNVAFL